MVLGFLRDKKGQFLTVNAGALCCVCCCPFTVVNMIIFGILNLVGYSTGEIISIFVTFYGMMLVGFFAFAGIVGPYLGPVFGGLGTVFDHLIKDLPILPYLFGVTGKVPFPPIASHLEKAGEKMGRFMRTAAIVGLFLLIAFVAFPKSGTFFGIVTLILTVIFAVGGITKKLPNGICVIMLSLLFCFAAVIINPISAILGAVVMILIVIVIVIAIIAAIVALSVATAGGADAVLGALGAGAGAGAVGAGAGAATAATTAGTVAADAAVTGGVEVAATTATEVGADVVGEAGADVVGEMGADVLSEGGMETLGTETMSEGMGEGAMQTGEEAEAGTDALDTMDETAQGAEEGAEGAEETPQEKFEKNKKRAEKAKDIMDDLTKQRDERRSRLAAAGERGGIGARIKGMGIEHLILVALVVIFVIPFFLGFLCLFNTFGSGCLYIEDTFGLWQGKFWQAIIWPMRIIWENLANMFFRLKQTIIPPTIMGVPVTSPLKYESCYPFCISQTGKDEKWNGLDVDTLQAVPSTVMDYQQWSIKMEIVNKGTYDARFKIPLRPEFGSTRTCEWNFRKRAWEWYTDCVESEADPEFFGLDPCLADCGYLYVLELTDSDPYVAGGCYKEITNEDGQVVPGPESGYSRECTLEPSDSIAVYWYGNKILWEATEVGDVFKPDVKISVTYKYKPINDLVGELPVFGLETQLAATETKSIGRIANKISQSYSPVGPLMMAMGSAEEQVIGGIPTLFMVQFANKGDGIVQPIETNDILYYIPEEFSIMDGGQCDFEYYGGSHGNSAANDLWPPGKTDIGLPSYHEKHPGPGFENYIVLKPKKDHDLPELERSANPLDNPVLACILNTPEEVDLKSYTFKVRVFEYEVEETETVQIKVLGTDVEVEEG